MGITVKSRKMLWGRAASRCAFPDCKRELIFDESMLDDESIVGDEAHIRSEKADGPRYDDNFPKDKIDEYGNLLLLCKVHHKLVDDQVHTFPVEKLIAMKKNHEKWVNDTLGFDKKKQNDDELYLTYLEEINDLLDIEHWESWTYDFMASNSTMRKDHHKNLTRLVDYLLNRVWPHRYERLEIAFHHLRITLNDFLMVFNRYREDEKSDDWYSTQKIYKIRDFDEANYNRLHKIYLYHEGLLADLLCELTRAINYLYEMIRIEIMPSYKLKEGVLLMKVDTGLEVNIYRLEYTEEEKKDIPYKGLKDFMSKRSQRDLYFGKGVSEDYFSS